jgi:hypothetical protein
MHDFAERRANAGTSGTSGYAPTVQHPTVNHLVSPQPAIDLSVESLRNPA